MEKPALLFITSLLLLSSCPCQLHAQTTDANAAGVTHGGATAMTHTESQTEPATNGAALMPTDHPTLLTAPESTPENAISDSQTTPELPTTELVTTTTTEKPTTVTLLQTKPETTRIPKETTQIIPIAIQTTRPGPTTPPATTQIIPETTQTTRSDPISTPSPTTPTMDQSTSTSTSAPPESTSAETTSTAPSTTLPPFLIPVISISSKPYPETSPTTTGATDSPGTSDSSAIPGGPIVVGGSSSVEDTEDTSNKSMWLGVIGAGLVAALASIACIALVVRRRRQKQGRGFGDAAVNGRSRRKGKKKGEEDAWAGPVLMGGADDCDGNGYTGDVEDNNNGGPADGTEPMLSTFAPSEDEEKAVGAEGTKEAKKWQEQSPLLYIDEDAEEEEEEAEGIPANRQASSQDGHSVEKKGEVRAETGGALDGAVAFCQTTAV